MGFDARIYLQGAGQLRLASDKQSLEVYHPTNRAAEELGLITAGEICEHHSFIQFSAQQLDPANEDVWLTAMLDREEVEVEVQGAKATPLAIGAGGHVDGVANLHDLLAGIASRPCALRTDLEARRAELLHAKVRVRHGKVEAPPVSRREWRVGTRPDGTPRDVLMSGLVLVELGEVEALSLRIASFDGVTTRRLHFHPKAVTDSLEVWIRHFCNFGRPDLQSTAPLPLAHRDRDFVLNYALLEEIRTLSADQKRRLPIPEIIRPGQIGGDHTDCQCSTC